MAEHYNVPGSFRDPSGFVFVKNDVIYRQVNKSYSEDFDCLMTSGLYDSLVSSGLIVKHEDVSDDFNLSDGAYKILRPDQVDFISYPYEWCFSQLKDAALTTLQIQAMAIERDMTLKDCSAYNLQFTNEGVKFIDILSFERYVEGNAWEAYKQFCQHFLNPLLIIAYTDVRLAKLSSVYIDGIELDISSKLLPVWTWFKPSILIHIHLHSMIQKRYSYNNKVSTNVLHYTKKKHFSKTSMKALVDNLTSMIQALRWKHGSSSWSAYNSESYNTDAFTHKKQLVEQYLGFINPTTVFDLGANVGLFSRVAAKTASKTVSFDMDPVCVEMNYLKCKEEKLYHLLPLVLDLANPSPSIGWENIERMSFMDRALADTVIALALIHHLIISNNVPLSKLSKFFKQICRYLIIEFVPKDDPMSQNLLTLRKDIFLDYTQDIFEAEMLKYFKIVKSQSIKSSKRTIYLMENNDK